jgi:glycogen debranching enzyme
VPSSATLRPNQIIAASLPFTCLSRERAQKVVAVVERELLTPFGLRSLARGDGQYRPRYEGDPRTRDSAYHQGTVWPWLLGPFVTAYVRANRGSVKSRRQAAGWLDGVRAHLSVAGLGHVSEIFDADDPHSPRGCAAQAWSVAEILRALVEDVHNLKPVTPKP